jgi:N-acetylneuraminate synthase
MTLRTAIATATPAGRPFRAKHGCIVVGEVAQAHDGSLGLAHAFIDAIAAAGADAVKFQTHIARAESTLREPWRVPFSAQDESRYAYWRRMEFSEAQWVALKTHAESRGLIFMSSPFSVEAVELLQRLGVAVWKLASGEINNVMLIEAMLQHRVPVVLSSGMNTLAELDEAVARIDETGLPHAVLQCTSAYPCPPEKIGLNMLSVFRERYRCPVGLSDHSGTPYPGLAAAVLGAELVEVHVTLSREMFGPDVPASVTSTELKHMVEGIRLIETMLDHPVDKDAESANLEPLRRAFTKSIVARCDLDAGTVLTSDHLAIKKPGTGLPASKLAALVGGRLVRPVRADDVLLETDIEVGS